MHNMRQRDYNHGHNILELYNVLIQTQLTTSKTKRDIYYGKLGTYPAQIVVPDLILIFKKGL